MYEEKRKLTITDTLRYRDIRPLEGPAPKNRHGIPQLDYRYFAIAVDSAWLEYCNFKLARGRIWLQSAEDGDIAANYYQVELEERYLRASGAIYKPLFKCAQAYEGVPAVVGRIDLEKIKNWEFNAPFSDVYQPLSPAFCVGMFEVTPHTAFLPLKIRQALYRWYFELGDYILQQAAEQPDLSKLLDYPYLWLIGDDEPSDIIRFCDEGLRRSKMLNAFTECIKQYSTDALQWIVKSVDLPGQRHCYMNAWQFYSRMCWLHFYTRDEPIVHWCSWDD